MANTIQLRRSAVASAVPTTTQLALGELAINTYDGKLYLKKDNGTQSIVEVGGSTNPTVSSAASITSPLAWNSNSYNMYIATAQSTALTINSDSGTPVEGEKVVFRFEDNGSARALTWTTGTSKSFRAVGVTLPTTTVAGKTMYIGCIYNSTDDRWDVIAVSQEA